MSSRRTSSSLSKQLAYFENFSMPRTLVSSVYPPLDNQPDADGGRPVEDDVGRLSLDVSTKSCVFP
jgi:hypothetical protein